MIPGDDREFPARAFKFHNDTRRTALRDRELRRSTAYAMAAARAHSNRVSNIGAFKHVATRTPD